MPWTDFFKLFQNTGRRDPLSQKTNPDNFPTAGVASPEAINNDLNFGGGPSQGGMRQSYDMIDTTTLNNRDMRYKEYERLRAVPEIEGAMTVFADEACVAGDTKIATPFGFITIKELAEKKAEDRFLVYCYDFDKKDYTLGWAFAPRKVKTEKTIRIMLDNGSSFTATADHRVLKKNGEWVETGELKFGDELMPFYRLQSKREQRVAQHPRIFSRQKGWIHERQFVDDWKSGKTKPNYEQSNKVARMLGDGLTFEQISQLTGRPWPTVKYWIDREGFSPWEIKQLYKQNEDRRRVIGVHEDKEQDVYDLSVDKHKCFATDSVILHNCQKDEDGDILKVEAANEEVRKEAKFLLLNRKMLNLNRHGLIWFKNLLIFGDWFVELVVNPDNPKEGIYRAIPLPPETMFRIETKQHRLVEFQQSKEGPDTAAVIRDLTGQQSDMELNQTKAIRFAPNQICHFRIGDDRKTFYPYGQSLIENARGPAHTLRQMEDAMVVYRIIRAPERRVFYIDVGNLSPARADQLLDRLKDQYRKRKIGSNRGVPGASQVEERWQPPAVDEDIWMGVRPNTNTRIETLPGAENLGEIDDAIYFRNKLLTALNFPKNYFNNEDPNATRITLSAQDVKFARMIERLQSHFEDGLLEIVERHLDLRGFPAEAYEDLKIRMTPPSDWRELSRAEIWTSRYANAGTLKSGQLMADFDIYTKIFKFSDDDAQEMLARLKLQKLEDLKLQVLAQNPALMGIGIPGQEQTGQEIGSEPGGPAPMPDPSGGSQPPPQEPPAPPAAGPEETPPEEGVNLPEPEGDDIKRYDLEIQDYEREIDRPDIDYSLGD